MDEAGFATTTHCEWPTDWKSIGRESSHPIGFFFGDKTVKESGVLEQDKRDG